MAQSFSGKTTFKGPVAQKQTATTITGTFDFTGRFAGLYDLAPEAEGVTGSLPDASSCAGSEAIFRQKSDFSFQLSGSSATSAIISIVEPINGLAGDRLDTDATANLTASFVLYSDGVRYQVTKQYGTGSITSA